MSKYRVGDKVHIEAEIKQIGDVMATSRTLFADAGGVSFWIAEISVVKHFPAPREFKLGDQVRVDGISAAYEFVATRGNSAILWRADRECATAAKLSAIRHADEA